MKNTIKTLSMILMCALVIAVSVPTTIYCNDVDVPPAVEIPDGGDGNNADAGGGGDYSLEGVEELAIGIANDASDSIFNVVVAVMPLALLIIGLVILFTHDNKKIGGMISLAGTVLVVFAVMYLVHNGAATQFVESLFNR